MLTFCCFYNKNNQYFSRYNECYNKKSWFYKKKWKFKQKISQFPYIYNAMTMQ